MVMLRYMTGVLRISKRKHKSENSAQTVWEACLKTLINKLTKQNKTYKRKNK